MLLDLDGPDFDPGLLGRLTTASAATADVALRTVAASLVAGTVAPLVLFDRFSIDTSLLDFYEQVADGGDASKAFVAPEGAPAVRSTRQLPLRAGRLRGRVELLSYPSRYTPLHPELADQVDPTARNQTVWAQHWRHRDGPRPTLVVVHGFTASPYIVNSAFFALPWLYTHGYDVVLFTLPFHGRRKERHAPYSGSGLFSRGIAWFNESMLQAVHDIRSLLEYLLAAGVPRVGITGLSLGGYTTAMLAAAEPRLAFAIPNCAVTDMAGILDTWFPATQVLRGGMAWRGIDEDAFARATRVHGPLTYPSQLDRERLFVIHGLGDRLAPPEQGRRLWEHWGRPKVHWFPGNHTLHVNRAAYLRRIGRFLNDLGFGD